jgi:predicted dehydrogenase
VALADAFPDRVELTKESLQAEKPKNYAVDDDHIFTGVDCHEKIVQTDVDVVLLATPPHFRPAQVEACVAANKHVFVEKPVAVDAQGARRILAACEQAAEKGLSVVSGLCWRYDDAVNEVMGRIKDGAIGEITAIQSDYLTGTLWYRTPKKGQVFSSLEEQLRNWIYYYWLSGDITAEQHVHSIDKALWLMDDVPPVSCYSSGGRAARTEKKYGNVYDHFATVFEWEDGRKAFSHCRQVANCFTQVDDFAFGTEGTAAILSNTITNSEGVWKYKGVKPSMYVNEHKELVKSIRSGVPINNGKYMTYSTVMAIMARDAAYTGKKLNWDEYMKSDVVLGPKSYDDLDYVPDPIQIPGKR